MLMIKFRNFVTLPVECTLIIMDINFFQYAMEVLDKSIYLLVSKHPVWGKVVEGEIWVRM